MVRGIRFVLAMALMSVAVLSGKAQSGRTFYIDHANGSNGNNGSKSSPWKTHPFMQAGSACTGSGAAPNYTHMAGDSFVFKGGVTWPAACFGMLISEGGSSATVTDYYGVDKSWFAGASFTRPTFDLQGTPPTTVGVLAGAHNVIYVSGGFIVLDNFEIKNMAMVGGHGGPDIGYDCAVFFTNGSKGNWVKNGYFHDWTTTPAGLSASYSNCAGGIGQSGGNFSADSMEIGNPNGLPVPFGGCFANPSEVKNSKCHDVGQGVNGFGSVHDSEFYNITDVSARSPYTNGLHTNTIQQTWPGGTGSVYNNLIHDNSPGQQVAICPTGSVYNNVMWHIRNGGGAPIIVDTGINACTVNLSTVANVYNNTVDCTQMAMCLAVGRTGNSIGTVNIRNNHWIVNAGENPVLIQLSISNLNQTNNVTMSSSTAAAQGYTIFNNYAPTSSSNATVNAAMPLSSSCGGILSALCEDLRHNPRLTSWDAGAYEFGAQSSAKPNPPSNLAATVQ